MSHVSRIKGKGTDEMSVKTASTNPHYHEKTFSQKGKVIKSCLLVDWSVTVFYKGRPPKVSKRSIHASSTNTVY